MLGLWGFRAYYKGQVQSAGRVIPKIRWTTDILTKNFLQLFRGREVQNMVKPIILMTIWKRNLCISSSKVLPHSLRHFEIHANCVLDNYISFVMSSVMWGWQLTGNCNLVGNGIGFWFLKVSTEMMAMLTKEICQRNSNHFFFLSFTMMSIAGNHSTNHNA